MTDEEFFAFLNACREELATKQRQFEQLIHADGRWSCDLADGSLAIGAERFPITALGTHSPEYQTWLWALANEDFPSSAREASRRLQSLHELTSFQVFLDPGIAASSADAQDFAALAVHHLGAIGFFRVPSDDGPTLYLAVHDPRELRT